MHSNLLNYYSILINYYNYQYTHKKLNNVLFGKIKSFIFN